MVRKIIPEQSVATASPATTPVYIPAGSRIISVRGEADGKDVYDFLLTFQICSTAAVTTSMTMKYAGIKNGKVCNLWREWPQVVSDSAAPVSVARTALAIQAGNGVVLQIYYSFGSVAI